MACRERTLAALLVGVFLAGPAAAQTQCAPRPQVVERLAREYGEAQAGSGLMSNGRLFELFIGPGGSWSVLSTGPAGISCLVASGDGWLPGEPPALPKRDS